MEGRVLAAEIADQRLDLGGDLVRANARAMRPIGQRGQAPQFVAGDPDVHALA
jgi:hypothetical protein